MKTALITTTINLPTVLKLYRACGPDVAFFVAGDEKTPEEVLEFCDDIDATYLGYGKQHKLGYACSDLIGWNTIARRNIALLEALRWGAEIIVTIDDDNLPLSTDYFWRFEKLLNRDAAGDFNGIKACGCGYPGTYGADNWFDVGELLTPKAPHRGFPFPHKCNWTYQPVTDAKIGVAAGICLGDPDIGAVERIANAPIVHGVSELLRSGIVVDPQTKTVFNSQNTAFLRELAPCFLMCPQLGRMDDIWASLVAQRIMRSRGLHVHFGMTFCWQQRNPHDLIKDLKAEMLGYERTVAFATWLDSVKLADGDSVLVQVQQIYSRINEIAWMPPGVSDLGAAWVKDCETVL